MKAIVRNMIFSALKTRFPDYTKLIIYPKDKKVVVEFSNNTTKNFPTGETDEKYFTMLSEAMNIKEVNSIYVSHKDDVILVRGDKDEFI